MLTSSADTTLKACNDFLYELVLSAVKTICLNRPLIRAMWGLSTFTRIADKSFIRVCCSLSTKRNINIALTAILKVHCWQEGVIWLSLYNAGY